MPPSKVLTAPRCRIMIDGKILARGTNVSYTAEISYEDVVVIDKLEVDEFAPTGYTVNGSISVVRVRDTTVKSLGIIPETGKNSEEHLQNVLLQADVTMVLMDKADPPKNLAVLTGVKFLSYGWALAARGIASENIPFKAIRETDESEASA